MDDETPPRRRPGREPPSTAPRTTEPAQDPKERVLGLQRTLGNAATARLMRQETETPPAPAVAKTAPQAVNLAIEPDAAIVFKTAAATLGGVSVHVTARMSLSGKAVLVGEKLPDKQAAQFVRKRVRELTATAFGAAAPTGTPGKIELALAGDTLALELADGADKSPAFEVSGRFEAGKRSFTVPGCEVSDASVTLDATVWIAPSAAPAADAAGDASVKRFAFAGAAANFKDARPKTKDAERSGTVVSKAAMDAFEAKVPDLVKNHSLFKLPEQRAAFFQQMRAYFGDDMKAVEHFAKLRKASVKGATTILHDEAATRLEKVQAEIGNDKMPSSGGVGWPRSECKLSGKQDLANLHNLGFAVDYNAYEAPNLKDESMRDLITVVTGRAALGELRRRARRRAQDRPDLRLGHRGGEGEAGRRREAEGVARPVLGKETESLGKASEDFRGSLKGKDAAGAEVDFAPKLKELRAKWFAAKTKDEKDKILAELPVVLKPWLDKVDAQKKDMETKIRAVIMRRCREAGELLKADELDGAETAYLKLLATESPSIPRIARGRVPSTASSTCGIASSSTTRSRSSSRRRRVTTQAADTDLGERVSDGLRAAEQWLAQLSLGDWVLFTLGAAAIAWIVTGMAMTRLGPIEIKPLEEDSEAKQPIKGLTAIVARRLHRCGLIFPSRGAGRRAAGRPHRGRRGESGAAGQLDRVDPQGRPAAPSRRLRNRRHRGEGRHRGCARGDRLLGAPRARRP